MKFPKIPRHILVPSSIFLFFILLGGIGSYYLYSQKLFPFQKAQVTETTTDQTTETGEPTGKEDPTADWTTYTNETFGFEIKYPTDWIYKEGLSEELVVGFRLGGPEPPNPNAVYIRIMIRDNPEGLKLEEFYSTRSRDASGNRFFIEVEKSGEIEVAGIWASKFDYDPGPVSSTTVAFPYKDKIYELSKINDKSYPEIDTYQIFINMISTFKFLAWDN